MKKLNRNGYSFEQPLLRGHQLNEDADTDSKSWKLLQKAQFWQTRSIKTYLLRKSHRTQIKAFQIKTNEEFHCSNEICKLSQNPLRN